MNKNTFYSNELCPNELETRAAISVFTSTILKYQNDINMAAPEDRCAVAEAAVCEAIIEVWRKGRIYQRDQSVDKLMELVEQGAKQTKGIDKPFGSSFF